MKTKPYMKTFISLLLALVMFAAWGVQGALAQCAGRIYPDVDQVFPLLDPLTVPKYVNLLPNALDPAFVYTGSTGTSPIDKTYTIGVYEVTHDPGLGVGTLNSTTVWAYGETQATATYPGRTFFARGSGNPAVWGNVYEVTFTNNLTVEGTPTGTPLNHLFPIDTTLEWADPLQQGKGPGPYCGPVPIVTHIHGGHTDTLSDGLPDAWYTPDTGDADTFPDFTGRMYNPVYTYENSQEAATVWYHDHALGITRLNVYAGLAGFFIIRDNNEIGLGLPGSPYSGTYGAPTATDGLGNYLEIAMVIQDRQFYLDNVNNPQLYYPCTDPAIPVVPTALPEFFGDVILVNGKAWPKLDVQPRWYRIRVLNGSDSAFYNLYFSGSPTATVVSPARRARTPTFYQIGTDLGFMDAPVPLKNLVLGPGERADLLVDFNAMRKELGLRSTATARIYLRNDANQPFPFGAPINPATVGQIMRFDVALGAGTDTFTLPTNLRPSYPSIATLRANMIPDNPPRQLILFEAINTYGRLEPSLGTFAGINRYVDPITEIIPNVGDTEVWEIYNLTPDAHPIHLHLVHFYILDRRPFTATADPTTGAITPGSVVFTGPAILPLPNEAGMKDTVQAYPGEVTRVIATFDRPEEYVWHCHILSHEDHEMMRPFWVGPGYVP